MYEKCFNYKCKYNDEKVFNHCKCFRDDVNLKSQCGFFTYFEGKYPNVLSVTVLDGKYTVIQKANGGTYALRYGEEWRDCVGDGLILALAQRIDELEKEKN